MVAIEILSQSNRKAKRDFNCGKTLLDNYLRIQASQDIRKKLAVCFVYVERETGFIQGYYTLSNNSIPIGTVPEDYKRLFPTSYLSIPTTLIGRLAVDERYKGSGIGRMLLIDALQRSYMISKSVGSFAVVVDPLDEDAERFNKKYGFILLPDSQKMFLPMKTLETLFEQLKD